MVKLSSFPPIPDFSYLQGVGIWYPLSLAVCQRPQLQPHGIVTAGSTVLNDLKMRRGKCGWKSKNMRTSQSPALFVHSHVPSFVFHELGMKIPHFGTKTSNKWPSHLDPVPWNSHCRASEHATDRCRVLAGPTAIKNQSPPKMASFSVFFTWKKWARKWETSGHHEALDIAWYCIDQNTDSLASVIYQTLSRFSLRMRPGVHDSAFWQGTKSLHKFPYLYVNSHIHCLSISD